jgi:hypothetical protein
VNAREHREQAEELLEQSTEDDLYPADVRDRMIARAQVHATLFMGLQLAIEFDPTSVVGRMAADVREHAPPAGNVRPLNIPPRLGGDG